jgi:hypothetical protein
MRATTGSVEAVYARELSSWREGSDHTARSAWHDEILYWRPQKFNSDFTELCHWTSSYMEVILPMVLLWTHRWTAVIYFKCRMWPTTQRGVGMVTCIQFQSTLRFLCKTISVRIQYLQFLLSALLFIICDSISFSMFTVFLYWFFILFFLTTQTQLYCT